MGNIERVKPTIVEKEDIPSLTFNVKTKVKQKADLIKDLISATTLGNIHHGKVAIIFEDDEGLKQVETTIWCTADDHICLKGGIWLPINRIHRVII